MSRKKVTKKEKKGGFSKFIITLVILMNICFTSAILYVFLQTGNEPGVLVGSWFAFTTGEVWMLALIKKEKVKKGDNDNERG